ncbi:hypothetical protein A2647_01945 [Candidatus Nomurabacteria bacterium RIFCSPHIGHO2_01_FULL_40_24b]|uniref:Bifunctional protein FolD n=1 Tax=Candidatus Nomurabacteria bacterium RIFCSPHIGHO2_01_FULL_40_24b TaxID=1801739 RepID=A0A1F6V8T6_9BACT|nr:MAG: hypothetical protein A2647_01945 [Candidatus Nomurabacteria bacterium RIFCSPHIGHO2_01_FULL_40_24b]
MYIIDGKKIREEILAEIKQEVARLPFTPLFCDVLVGNDFVSKKYVKMKAQIARSLGIDFNDASFPATITTEELVKEIKKLNQIKNMCGIIIQLPLPESIDRRAVLDAIDPELDVDCLGSVASENFYKGQVDFGFPTALACVAVLDSLNLDLKEKKIVVLGQGELVGKPTMAFLRLRGLFPIAVDRSTENKETIIKEADVIISGIGKGKHITGDMIKKGVVLIDAGTSESSNSLVGDVDLESVKNVASAVSPVPGGVGPVTVAMLFRNVLRVAQAKMTKKDE